jgi:hypothetical protein
MPIKVEDPLEFERPDWSIRLEKKLANSNTEEDKKTLRNL